MFFIQRSDCRAANFQCRLPRRALSSARASAVRGWWKTVRPQCTTEAPSEEKFPEEICSSPEQGRKSAARQGDFAESAKPVLRQIKNESAQIFVGTLDWYCTASLEPQGCLRGRGPSVGKGFSRETLGFPLCVFFLLQSVFFLARARKKMRLDQLAGLCQKNSGPWATARKSPKSPAAVHGKNDFGVFQKNIISSYFVYKYFITETIDNCELRWYTAFSTHG